MHESHWINDLVIIREVGSLRINEKILYNNSKIVEI